MALIVCSECGKEISDTAKICPHCGCQTQAGKKELETKQVMRVGLGNTIATVIGGILFLPNFFEMMENFNRLDRWIRQDGSTWVIIKMTIGLGILVGGMWVSHKLTQEAKNAQWNDARRTRENSYHYGGAPYVHTLDPNALKAIPYEKEHDGECERCHKHTSVASCTIANSPYNYELCLSCINRYHANIK